MKTTKIALVVAAAASSALADDFTLSGTVTADNHYAIYTNAGGVMSYIGGNETGAAGAPGTYNWSQGESWNFTPGTSVYIAAWSDKAVAQGLLAEFELSFGHNRGSAPIRTGSDGWDVVGTGLDMNDGSPHPTASLIEQEVLNANQNYLWHLPHVGDRNLASTQPWGKIEGIGEDAHWVWNQVDGNPNPLSGGHDANEMLIFRFFIPTPGTMACAGLGGLMLLRRRR